MKNIRKITAVVLCLFTAFMLFSTSISAAASIKPPEKLRVVSVSADSVTVSWTAVSGISSYRVYYLVNGSWKIAEDTGKTSATVKKLNASTTYAFAVKSRIKVGSKEYLSDEYAYVKTRTNGLTAPALSGTAGDDYINLSWTRVPGAAGYAVYSYNGSSWKRIGVTAKTVGVIKNLAGGKTFVFAVRAYTPGDGKAIQGPASNFIKIKTVDPNKVKVSCVAVSDSAVKLQWTKAPSATGYRVYSYSDGLWLKVGDVKNPNKIIGTINGLLSDTQYIFRVRAFRVSGSKVTWYEPSDICYATTNPGAMDAYVYRTDSLREIFGGDSYMFSYVTTDKTYGKIPVTIAKSGENYYLRSKVNERPYTILAQSDGSSYILLEESKVYIKLPATVLKLFDIKTEMQNLIPPEEWTAKAGIVNFNSQKVVCESFTNPEKTKEIRFYYKAGKFLGMDEIGLNGLEARAVAESLTSTADASLFVIPESYTKIFFGMTDSLELAGKSLIPAA